MGFITDLIKKGILNEQSEIEKTKLQIPENQQEKLRKGEVVLIEDGKGSQVIVRIKESSLKKSDLTNDDFEIRQIETPRAAKNQIEL